MARRIDVYSNNVLLITVDRIVGYIDLKRNISAKITLCNTAVDIHGAAVGNAFKIDGEMLSAVTFVQLEGLSVPCIGGLDKAKSLIVLLIRGV